jgi:hypothetical protein
MYEGPYILRVQMDVYINSFSLHSSSIHMIMVYFLYFSFKSRVFIK